MPFVHIHLPTMKRLWATIERELIGALIRALVSLLVSVRVEGREHLPRDPRPTLLIANHFSWFDPPILGSKLPFYPAFVTATEAQRDWWARLLVRVFNGIPVWRGQVDREVFRRVVHAMENGYIVAVFPEGGMDPELTERIARGEQIRELRGHMSRQKPELIRAKAGAALMAVQSQARILPVVLVGADGIEGNLKRRRRTRVTLRIGPMFGPLKTPSDVGGRTRRESLNRLADEMMEHLAALLPPEQRGPYRGIPAAGLTAPEAGDR